LASFNQFQDFVEQLCKGVHNFSTHTFKVYLSNTAPNAATHAVKTDLAEISSGNGYTAGGNSTTVGITETGGTATVTGTDPAVWTASGGALGPFRYAVLYNDTPTSPADPLIAWWDYGSAVTLQVGETFTVDFGASLFTVA